MGFIGKALKAKKSFDKESHKHISVSSDGVISTTSEHYMKSEKAKAKVIAASKSLSGQPA